MPRQRAVYYSVDDDPKYLYFAIRSVASLRRYNRDIPVRVFVHGQPPARARTALRRAGAEVVVRPAIERHRLMLLKWQPLELLREPRQLFIDADTVFFGNVDRLFRDRTEHDFYARIEMGTEAVPPYLVGNQLVVNQVNHHLLRKLTATLGGRDIPVFNTGVMLMNHDLHKLIAEAQPLFELIRDKLDSGAMPFPCSNRHIRGEMISTLAMSTLRGLTWGVLPQAITPYYVEVKGGEVDDPGVVMHMWTAYYPFYVRDYEGPKELARLLAVMRRSAARRATAPVTAPIQLAVSA